MNIAEYIQTNTYPLSTQGLDFIQKQILEVQKVCSALGDGNWIIKGCEQKVVGDVVTITEGAVVIDGEIISVSQQKYESKCFIRETVNQSPRRIYRELVFSTSLTQQNYDWNTFRRVDISKLATKEEVNELRNLVMPTGAIIMWSGTMNESDPTFPNGFVPCDGRTVDGFGQVPDLRSRFVVGYDERTKNMNVDYSEIGYVGGEAKHTLTTDEIPSHTHSVNDYYQLENIASIRDKEFYGGTMDVGGRYVGVGDTDEDNTTMIYKTHNTASRGGDVAHENRPPYFVIAYLIKII